MEIKNSYSGEERRRNPSNSPAEQSGLLARYVKTRYEAIVNTQPAPNLDQIGIHPDLQLRKRTTPDSSKKITSVIQTEIERIQKNVKDTTATTETKISKSNNDSNEIIEDPQFAIFKKQFQILPENLKTFKKRTLSWEEVQSAIPHLEDFLEAVKTIKDPEVYLINDPEIYYTHREGAQLIIGESAKEVRKETRNLTYNESRAKETMISYLDAQGKLVVVQGDKDEKGVGYPWRRDMFGEECRDVFNRETNGEKITPISRRGFLDQSEYCEINKTGKFDINSPHTHLESGKNPSSSYEGRYFKKENRVTINKSDPRKEISILTGSRIILRVYLNLKH